MLMAGSMQPSQEPQAEWLQNTTQEPLFSHTLKCSPWLTISSDAYSYKELEKFLYNSLNAPSWMHTLELSNARAVLTCSPWNVTLYLLQSDALADDQMLLASCIHCLHLSFHLLTWAFLCNTNLKQCFSMTSSAVIILGFLANFSLE